MKTCTYCGKENEDQATKCPGCGTEFPLAQTHAESSLLEPSAEDRLERIAVLDSEVQSELVDAILSERQIPHVMQSYHDSAYDGLFQVGQGWGVLLAPPNFRNEISAILADIKRQSESPSQDEKK